MFKRYLQKQFINFLVKHLYNTIGIKDVLRTVEDKRTKKVVRVFLGDKTLDQTDRSIISDDAKKFADSTIWKLVRNSVYYNCDRELKTKCKSGADMLGPKTGFWIIDIIDKTLEQLKKI